MVTVTDFFMKELLAKTMRLYGRMAVKGPAPDGQYAPTRYQKSLAP